MVLSRLRAVTPEGKIGFVVGIAAFVLISALAFAVWATLELRTISLRTRAITQSTNALIRTGTSPSAKRLAGAAETDRQLICAVLRPALTNTKVAPDIKIIIRRDCR